jgi:hypothetical protein
MAKRSVTNTTDKQTCTCYCLYYSQDIYKIYKDGRKCLYDMSTITSVNKQCGRANGPCLPKPYLPMVKNRSKSKPIINSEGTLL